MPTTAIIEIHRHGAWEPAAELQPLGDERCRLEYLAEYVFGPAPEPIALGLPVRFNPDLPGDDGTVDRSVPSFLYDLVPQGKGRGFLLRLLALPDADGLVMPLLMAGAFNPIGRLRLDSAVAFFDEQACKQPQHRLQEGLALDDIRQRSDEFLDHISLHSMLAAGTTGVQGVSPKFLMVQDSEGGWFADLALPDERARAHWLLKLPRGKSDDDRAVLRNEAAYLRLAARCGLRAPFGDKGIEDGVMLVDEMLFVRRFDRLVQDGKLHRLHQESLASLAGLRGFGQPVTQNELLKALRSHATDPRAETLEFIKRDVLNRSMRNTDNHARNTAMQRTLDGLIQLTPVFDFAPMFKDPEVVPRSVHWTSASGVHVHAWAEVLEVLASSALVSAEEHAHVVDELVAFAQTVGSLPSIAREVGVEPEILEQCRASIDAQAGQLATLKA